MVSQETRRKISEALKAYYAGKGTARQGVARLKGAARIAATDAENKVRSGYAKLTPSKVDDITTKVGNAKRSTVAMVKAAKDIGTAKKEAMKRGLEAAKPAKKEAVESFKSDVKTAVKKVLDKTTLDEKAVELYKKAKSKVTKKPASGSVPKTYRT